MYLSLKQNEREKMQINIKDPELDLLMDKVMKKRKIKIKTDYIKSLIKRDANDLGLLKIEDLI